jgi:hypothetical protein
MILSLIASVLISGAGSSWIGNGTTDSKTDSLLASPTRRVISDDLPNGSWADPYPYTCLWEMERTNTTSYIDTMGARGLSNSPSLWPDYTIVGTNMYGRVEHAISISGDGKSLYVPGNSRSVFNNATSFTIFAWVKLTNSINSVNASIASEWSYNGRNGIYMGGNKRVGAYIGNASGSKYIGIVSGTDIVSNEWTFVWARWRYKPVDFDKLELYMNETLVANSSGSAPTTALSLEGMCIGWNGIGSDGTNYFQGYIDGVGVFVDGATGYRSTNDMKIIMDNTHPTNNLRFR